MLGGTIFEMLAREQGPEACGELARAPDTRSPRGRSSVSGGRARSVERDWTDYLAALTAA